MSILDSKNPTYKSTRLQITGIYSIVGDIELQGDSRSLLELATLLSGGPYPITCDLLLPNLPVPKSYDGFLEKLTVIVDNNFINISLNESSLVISGSQEKIKILADNFEWLATNIETTTTGEVQNHLHIDYHPDHFFLAPSSKPLVVVNKTGDII